MSLERMASRKNDQGCFNCGSPNHWTKGCPITPAPKVTQTFEVTCTACGETGHGWKLCPVPVPLSPEAQKRADEDAIWEAKLIRWAAALDKKRAMRRAAEAADRAAGKKLQPRWGRV